MDAGIAFIAYTYVAPEEREATRQTVSVEGWATEIPGFDDDKALDYARRVANNLEYRWHPDPYDDPFAGLPQELY